MRNLRASSRNPELPALQHYVFNSVPSAGGRQRARNEQEIERDRMILSTMVNVVILQYTRNTIHEEVRRQARETNSFGWCQGVM